MSASKALPNQSFPNIPQTRKRRNSESNITNNTNNQWFHIPSPVPHNQKNSDIEPQLLQVENHKPSTPNSHDQFLSSNETEKLIESNPPFVPTSSESSGTKTVTHLASRTETSLSSQPKPQKNLNNNNENREFVKAFAYIFCSLATIVLIVAFIHGWSLLPFLSPGVSCGVWFVGVCALSTCALKFWAKEGWLKSVFLPPFLFPIVVMTILALLVFLFTGCQGNIDFSGCPVGSAGYADDEKTGKKDLTQP